MKEKIASAVEKANSLTEVKEALFGVFREYRQEGHTRIGYVSGIVTSEGPENIERNVERLVKFTEHIKTEQNFPIFSSADVFDKRLFARLGAANLKNVDWEAFWQEIFEHEEKFVTDMFMTPKWEKSRGATDEHRVAKKVGMNIVYITEEL